MGNREFMLGEIRRIMKDVGITSLSLMCKDYTAIWYDTDADCVFVKWADLYCNDGVKEINELVTPDIVKIYNDLKADFE